MPGDSDEAFTMLLVFYNMVREISRWGDPVAMELFRTLQHMVSVTFFSHCVHAVAKTVSITILSTWRRCR